MRARCPNSPELDAMGNGASFTRAAARGAQNAIVDKSTLLAWVDPDRERLTAFLSEFVRRASPNPPGNTRSCAELVCNVLAENELPYQIISPNEDMPLNAASMLKTPPTDFYPAPESSCNTSSRADRASVWILVLPRATK